MMQAEQAKQEVAKAEEKKKVVVSKVGFNREEESSSQDPKPWKKKGCTLDIQANTSSGLVFGWHILGVQIPNLRFGCPGCLGVYGGRAKTHLLKRFTLRHSGKLT